MTRLTEQYLLNYLKKKSLATAANQELNEAALLSSYSEGMKGRITPELLSLQMLRKGHALAISFKCQKDEAAAFDAYMTHLQEMSAGGP